MIASVLLGVAISAAHHSSLLGNKLIDDPHYSSPPHGLKLPPNYPKHRVFGIVSKTTHQLVFLRQVEGSYVVEVKLCLDTSFGSPGNPTPNGWLRATHSLEDNPDYSASDDQRKRNRKTGKPNFIPGGDPRNPLGSFRLRLNKPDLLIHGNNNAEAVGKFYTYGCLMTGNAHRKDLHRLGVGKGTRIYVEPLQGPAKLRKRTKAARKRRLKLVKITVDAN